MSGGKSKIPFSIAPHFPCGEKLFSLPKADEIKYLNILAFSVAALQLFSVFFCACNFHLPLICILQFAITQRELNFDRECLNADEIWAWLSLRIANPNEEIICWLISEWGSFSSVVAAVLIRPDGNLILLLKPSMKWSMERWKVKQRWFSLNLWNLFFLFSSSIGMVRIFGQNGVYKVRERRRRNMNDSCKN